MQSISRASLNKGVLIYLCCDALLCAFTTAYLHTQKSFCAKNKLSVTLAGVIPATGAVPLGVWGVVPPVAWLAVWGGRSGCSVFDFLSLDK